jgi:signal transduction histidine kinase/CheY-like chemotaxis protein
MNNKIKILHLEDSLRDSELIHSIIESGRIDHDYLLADNEKDFIHILRTENIDIILSDYSIPGYKGSEAFKFLQQSFSQIPFIFVSGTIGEDVAINAMVNGATDYVLKNKLERLVPAIKRAINERDLVIKREQSENNLREKNILIEAQNKKYIILNKELKFQNIEREKRAAELYIANNELIYQNEEKENRANELIAANIELEFQNQEKEKRANEYSILNAELSESLNKIQKINNELIISKEKAEESDKLKSAFLSNMSHEIRTPLNAIMGFSTLLLEPGITDDTMNYFVEVINTNSQQLLSIISDIMDISKIEAGQYTVNSELVDFNKLMDELFIEYQKRVNLKELNLSFSYNRHPDLIQVKTDGKCIRQVLVNLLNNAIKYTKKGAIEFGYKTREKFIEFYVKDSGIGIATEDQELIFTRFRQVKSNNRELNGGNGLGLPISKALVEKLGGTISVNSNPGQGSIFSFTIPMQFQNITESIFA